MHRGNWLSQCKVDMEAELHYRRCETYPIMHWGNWLSQCKVDMETELQGIWVDIPSCIEGTDSHNARWICRQNCRRCEYISHNALRELTLTMQGGYGGRNAGYVSTYPIMHCKFKGLSMQRFVWQKKVKNTSNQRKIDIRTQYAYGNL